MMYFKNHGTFSIKIIRDEVPSVLWHIVEIIGGLLFTNELSQLLFRLDILNKAHHIFGVFLPFIVVHGLEPEQSELFDQLRLALVD